MRILEVIIASAKPDRSLLTQHKERIDFLQNRIIAYADKLKEPDTSNKARDFLKSKIADDKREIAHHVGKIKEESVDSSEPAVEYVVYDPKTDKIVGGPYQTASRARAARDKKDMAYGAYRYSVRKINKNSGTGSAVFESINRLPLAECDFDAIKGLLDKPVPVVLARIYLQDLIDDDDLNSQFDSLESDDPGQDIRHLIADWVKRVMPDQLHRFQARPDAVATAGQLSPIHGYDSGSFNSNSETTVGNAFGRF